MRKLIVLGVIAAALTTAACNTVSGIGRDLVRCRGQAVTSGLERQELTPGERRREALPVFAFSPQIRRRSPSF